MKIVRLDRPADARPYIEPLLEAHYHEVGNTKLYDLAPDYDKYQAIYDSGNLFTLLAFEQGWCIGYSVNFMTPHVHYLKSRISYNDVLFVSQDFRDTSAGGRLILSTKAAAKQEGCTVQQWHAKPDTALFHLLHARMPIFEHAFSEEL